MEQIRYTNHSGGCDGADICWENEGLKYGVESVGYSFHNHKQYSYNRKILNQDELREGYHDTRADENDNTITYTAEEVLNSL